MNQKDDEACKKDSACCKKGICKTCMKKGCYCKKIIISITVLAAVIVSIYCYMKLDLF